MADIDSKITSRSDRLFDKPWLKGTQLYFVEYGLFLILLTTVIFLFSSLVFAIFSYIANSEVTLIRQLTGASLVAATFVLVPVMVALWRRVGGEERRRPALRLRRAHRFALYGFVFLQALAVIAISYLIMLGIVNAVISGFDNFGETILRTLLPGLFALAVHTIAMLVFLGKTPGLARSFMLALSAAMLVSALILLLVLAINHEQAEADNSRPLYDDQRELFQDEFPRESLRDRNFFDY